MSSILRTRALVLTSLAAAALLAGCMHRSAPAASSSGSLRIPFTKSPSRASAATPAGIGVNTYLWRASLDTLAFMPLASADPYGGVIITDWYQNPEKPDERFKATVYILDTRLRADGLNVSVFKQAKDTGGQWVDSAVTSQTGIDIENAILTRARQIRLSNLNDRG